MLLTAKPTIFEWKCSMGGIGFPQDARRLGKSAMDARRLKNILLGRQTPLRRLKKSSVDARRHFCKNLNFFEKKKNSLLFMNP